LNENFVVISSDIAIATTYHNQKLSYEILCMVILHAYTMFTFQINFKQFNGLEVLLCLRIPSSHNTCNLNQSYQDSYWNTRFCMMCWLFKEFMSKFVMKWENVCYISSVWMWCCFIFYLWWYSLKEKPWACHFYSTL